MVHPRFVLFESSDALYPGLNDLFVELHHRICQYLPQNDIWNLSRCSRYMSESFPSSITSFRTRGYDAIHIVGQLEALRRAPKLRELTIESYRPSSKLGLRWVVALVKNCPQLLRLRLVNCHIPMLAYAGLGFLSSLRKLEVQNSQVDEFHQLFMGNVLKQLTPEAPIVSSPSSSSVSSASSSSPLSDGTMSADSSCSDLSVGGGSTPSTTPSPRSTPLSSSGFANTTTTIYANAYHAGYLTLSSSGAGLGLSLVPPPNGVFSVLVEVSFPPLPAPAPPILFTGLESLTIVPTRTHELAIIVANLPTLRKLNATLEAEEMPSKYLAGTCKRLESLTLNTTYSDKTLPANFVSTFRTLKYLRKLDLSTGVDDNNMHSLCKKLTNLTSLHIRNAHNLGEVGLSEIRALPNLRTLFIDFAFRAISRSSRQLPTGDASDLAWILKFKAVPTLISLTFLLPDSFALQYVHDTLRRALPRLRRLQLGNIYWCS